MTRCTLLNEWLNVESTKIDEFELISDREFLDISKKNNKLWDFFFGGSN